MKRDPLAEVIDLAAARSDAADAAKLAASLMRTAEGTIYASLTNALVILAYDPALSGMLSYNAFTLRPLINRAAPPATDGAPPLPGPYPRAWDSVDVSLVTAYIQRVYSPRMSQETVQSAMDAEARLRQIHPLREYFNALVWDGTHRLDHWLHITCGCPDDDYHAAVGSKFLIAAVRRVRYPGTKFDILLVLEGPQGVGKSQMVRRMAGDENFSDSMPPNLESKDAAQSLTGCLITEFAELQHIVRSEVETIKGFLSRSVDRYRPPYERNVIEVPRQGIIVGTTNESDYLRDTTGNRRFWPVKVLKKVDLQWIDANRDQLWAEAAAREILNEPLYLEEDQIAATALGEQSDRLEQDIWHERTADFVTGRYLVTVSEILTEAIGVSLEKQTRREQMRVSNILRSLGWVVTVERSGNASGRPKRVYRSPEVVTTGGS